MKKSLPITISVLIVLFVILAVVCVEVVSRIAADVPEATSLTVSTETEDGGRLLFTSDDLSTSDASFDPDGVSALVIRSGDVGSASVSMTLESVSGSETFDLSFSEGMCRLPLQGYRDDRYFLSLTVKSDGVTTYLVSTPAAFAAALADTSAKRIDQIGNIALSDDGETVIKTPFTWRTNGFTFASSGIIRFSSGVKGEMEIANDSEDSIVAGGIFCETPEWDYTVAVPFGSFRETRSFYISASSVNGRKIDITELYIDSEADSRIAADRLGNPSYRPYLERIVCDGSFTMDAMTVRRALSFTFSGSIDIEGALAFDFDGGGEISVDTSGNARSLSQSVTFDTPGADVVWQGEDALTFEFIEQYMNVRSYNGVETDTRMGGSGESSISAGTLTDTVSGVSLQFVPDGSVIDLGLKYTDEFDPNRATVTADLTAGGRATLVSDGTNWYVTVTDTGGKPRGYRLDIRADGYMLPVIYITTDDGEDITSDEEYKPGTFSIDYNGAFEFPDIAGSKMNIRGRGNSSWKLDKKPYKIKFESAESLFGLRKAKKWVLIANHCDHTLIRNKVAYTVGTVLDNLVFVPSAYIVDVFINGSYRGVYQLSEQVEINRGRVPGEEDSTEADTDYLLEIGGKIENTSFGKNNFSEGLFRFLEIVDPDTDILTEEQFKFVSEYVRSVNDAIVSGGDYGSLLDVPSLIDWFLLYEYSYNIDGIFRRSDFLLKKKGGKLYFSTPWDFDYGFKNMGPNSDNCERWLCLSYKEGEVYDDYLEETIMTYLLEDENFIAQLKARWQEVGRLMLDTALGVVEDARTTVAPSAEANFTVWDMIDKRVQFERREAAALPTYDAHLDYLRDFLVARFEWMDKAINEM